jgi:hypothetical protein
VPPSIKYRREVEQIEENGRENVAEKFPLSGTVFRKVTKMGIFLLFSFSMKNIF